MHIPHIIFLMFFAYISASYGYTTDETYCTNDPNCTYAGCGKVVTLPDQPESCSLCPAGTYSSPNGASNQCKSCGPLPTNTETATFQWYNEGAAENYDECQFTYTCSNNAINTKTPGLSTTGGIHIDSADSYKNPCIKCGLNSSPNTSQTECVCTNGTHVQGQPTNITKSTDGQDCVPYIVSIRLQDPDDTNAPNKTLNILTTLDSGTQKYTLPDTLNDPDKNLDIELNTPNDDKTTIRKTIWGEKLINHKDTGYKITSWSNTPNFSDVTQNHNSQPNWTAKEFTAYNKKNPNATPTPIQLINKSGSKISTCTYKSADECYYATVPTKTGYNFSGWDCQTKDYKKEITPCAQTTVSTKDNLADISYGNDIILTTNWTPKTIRINYYTSNSAGQSIATNDNYQYDQGYTAKHPDDMGWGDTYTPTGTTFKHWICTTCSPQETFTAGTNISTKITDDSIEHTLTAHYNKFDIVCNAGTYLPANEIQCTDCLQGYYCTGGTYKHSNTPQGLSPCPAGSTSDENSTDITNCYITDQTKICDNNGDCFQIPTNIELNLQKITP